MQRHGASPYVVQPQASGVTSGAPSRPPASSKASAESVEYPQKRKRRVITAEEREDVSVGHCVDVVMYLTLLVALL